MDAIAWALQFVFRWVILTSVMASLLIAVVLVIRALMRDRLGAHWQYALWILVVLRLALPWLPTSSFSVYNLLPVRQMTSIAAVSDPIDPSANLSPLPTDSWQWGTAPEATVVEKHEAMPMEQRSSLATATHTLAWIWLAGLTVAAARSWTVNRRFAQRVARSAVAVDPELRVIMAQCRNEMSMRGPMMMIETPAVQSPALFGLLRPRLLIPPCFRETLSTSQIRHTFLHELTHLKRRDIALSWLMNAMVIIHWFNPLIAYAFMCMREDQELACDASVLALIRTDDRRDYGYTIIAMLEHFAASPQLPTLAGITGKKSQIKRRMTMISLSKGRTWVWSAIGIVLVTSLCFFALTNGRTQAVTDPSTGSPNPSAPNATPTTPPATPNPSPSAPNATAPITSAAAKGLLTDMLGLAKQGQVINYDFAAKTTVLDGIERLWGAPDQTDWVPEAKGLYVTYAKHNAAFGLNKGQQVFEVRSFDSQLKQITLTAAKATYGDPAYKTTYGEQQIIGYTAGDEFKLLLVFEPAASGDDYVLDHYSVLYPRGTVNMMADDPGRQW